MKDIQIICNVLEILKKIKYPDFQAMTISFVSMGLLILVIILSSL